MSRELVGSPAIWEPPANVTEYEGHPDLDLKIEIRFDSDGVRNHSPVPTDQKERVVAFFGDSFTENRRVDDRFTFTSLLDGITTKARVVNYGVDAYGLDQAYLRYKKYEAHDIRHVVYIFCETDLRNLYETGLVEVAQGERIVFRDPGPRPLYRMLGRMRLTYLVISAYYRLRGTPNDVFSGELQVLDWAGESNGHETRFHDTYADAVPTDLLSANPQRQTTQLAQTFVLLLRKWKAEVEARGRTFTVLVLPRQLDTDMALELFRPFDGRIVYLRQHFAGEAATFENDDHWNEYGNLEMAQILARLGSLPFHSDIVKPAFLEGWKSRIDQYYDEHR